MSLTYVTESEKDSVSDRNTVHFKHFPLRTRTIVNWEHLVHVMRVSSKLL